LTGVLSVLFVVQPPELFCTVAVKVYGVILLVYVADVLVMPEQ
jgi:hypothetical protein